MNHSYSMPTRVRFGEGVRSLLPSLASVAKASRIAFFAGTSSLKHGGHREEILKSLSGKEIFSFEDIHAEPAPGDLLRFVRDVRGHQCDCVIAVGGGSVLDTGKTVALLAMQPDVPPLPQMLPEHCTPPLPVVAIPTTSGTGSEVTPFAVFWDRKAMKKHSFFHSALYPEEALVDPELTYSMPLAVTASTGMDAFTQACEAYWNRDANPLSDEYALMAIARIIDVLPNAVKNGADKEARREMALGSLMAGLAFSNTRTTACHSISYPLTLRFGVPHGLAVGVMLPSVLLLNASVTPERGRRFFHALGVSSVEEAADRIRKMMKTCGLPVTLKDLGITEKEIDVIVSEGFAPERMGNNPYVFTADSLQKMLLSILR